MPPALRTPALPPQPASFPHAAGAALGAVTLLLAISIMARLVIRTQSHIPTMVLGVLLAIGLVFLLNRLHVASVWRRRADVAIELGTEMIWEATPEGLITFVSPSISNSLGYAPTELIGRHVSTLLPDDELAPTQQRWSAGTSANRGWTDQQIRVLAKDGREVVVQSSSMAIVGHRSRTLGFTGVTRLVSDAPKSAELDARRTTLHELISTRRIRMVAQPIVDLSSERVVGAEMLSRFESYSMSARAAFADADAVGLTAELELLALRASLAAADDLPDDLYISINVSPATLLSPRVQAVLAGSGVDADRVVLELTEHDPIHDYTPLRRALEPLRSQGLRLAVDDAGAGYSSFRHILRLQPDYIKLDRAIVSDISTDAGRRALAAAFVMFALEMDAQVIAEGVETVEELKTLATLGVDAAQGYLLQRPTDVREVWGSWAHGAPIDLTSS